MKSSRGDSEWNYSWLTNSQMAPNKCPCWPSIVMHSEIFKASAMFGFLSSNSPPAGLWQRRTTKALWCISVVVWVMFKIKMQ